MGIKIDWNDLLQPLIAMFIKAIIDAIMKAVESGEFAKAMTAISALEDASRFEGFAATEKLGKIAETLV